MADTVNYWQQIDAAISQIINDKSVIETTMVDDILSDDDWQGAIYTLELQQRQLEALRYAHRLCRMNDDEAESLLLNAQNGALRQSRTYTVKYADTPESIEAQFGIPIEQILDYNNAVVENLYPGYKLQIPISTDAVIQVSDSIPVYDTHTGNNILGKDIVNPMAVVNGDLQTVSPIDCFRQGISNIMDTRKGEHPLLPLFGWDVDTPANLPQENELQWRALKLTEALQQDERVQTITNVIATIDGEAVSLSADVIAVNGFKQNTDQLTTGQDNSEPGTF